MKRLMLAVLLLSLSALACGGGDTPAPDAGDPGDNAPAEAVSAPADAVEYAAICGHALPDIGKCGNYIKVDDAYVVLEHPSLGMMEWCKDGEKGATVKVAGEMVDGKFVASYYERVD